MLVSLVFVGAVVAALIRSTMNLAQYRVEVCMDYQGRSSCRTAAGSTEEFALRSATDNACALIATGVTDSMACDRTPPRSVRWLKRP
ncbi:MAG: hypothetical protein ABSF98_15495 [Bryobacteraceae bacterium]